MELEDKVFFEIRECEDYLRLVPEKQNFSAPDWIFTNIFFKSGSFQGVIAAEVNLVDFANIRNAFASLYAAPKMTINVYNQDRDFRIHYRRR
jgi:hypothetical protein